jgi:hypothetical protein
VKLTRGEVKGWMSRKLDEYWHSIHGSSQAKGFLKDPLLKELGNCST